LCFLSILCFSPLPPLFFLYFFSQSSLVFIWGRRRETPYPT
jgi:hypothetical protein